MTILLKFTSESVTERILKIGQRLEKLRARLLVFLTHNVHHFAQRDV